MSGEPNDSVPLLRRNGAEGAYLHMTGADLALHVDAVAGSGSLATKVLTWIFYEL